MITNNFENLFVWQKAYQYNLEIYKIANLFPTRELYGLSSQIKRASISITSNIVEGYN